MTTNFELTSGKNRALVCYCSSEDTPTSDFIGVIENVFKRQNIEMEIPIDPLRWIASPEETALNIALRYGDTERRLKVGGNFNDVCVGVFFYDQPAPPPEPKPEPEIAFIPSDELGNPVGEPVYEDVEPEPEPPSIPQLVCEALASAFEDGKAGASAFVISPDMSEFELEVE